jgi:hypothetical protein
MDDETLKGLTSLKVFVEGVDKADKRRGLTTGQLHADVAARLRQAGITVSAEATQYLYVNVNTLRARQRVTSFSVVVMVRQGASLVRDPAIIAPAAITWWKGTGGIIVTDDLGGVRDAVGYLVDQFITACRQQNPKP